MVLVYVTCNAKIEIPTNKHPESMCKTPYHDSPISPSNPMALSMNHPSPWFPHSHSHLPKHNIFVSMKSSLSPASRNRTGLQYQHTNQTISYLHHPQSSFQTSHVQLPHCTAGRPSQLPSEVTPSTNDCPQGNPNNDCSDGSTSSLAPARERSLVADAAQRT